MVQLGYEIVQTKGKWEDYTTLKKELNQYSNLKEYRKLIVQTAADAAASLEEVSGETIHDITDANKALEVWQKTDQVGTDGAATGKVEWSSSTGVVTAATFTLDAVATTTHAPLVTAVTTARWVRLFSLDSINAADEVLIGNVAGTEIFGVIKVAYRQMLKPNWMTRYISSTQPVRNFLGRIHMELTLETALVTLLCTFTPVGQTAPITRAFTSKKAMTDWEPCIELAAGTYVTWTIEDDNAAHPVATIEITYVEAWN